MTSPLKPIDAALADELLDGRDLPPSPALALSLVDETIAALNDLSDHVLPALVRDAGDERPDLCKIASHVALAWAEAIQARTVLVRDLGVPDPARVSGDTPEWRQAGGYL